MDALLRTVQYSMTIKAESYASVDLQVRGFAKSIALKISLAVNVYHMMGHI